MCHYIFLLTRVNLNVWVFVVPGALGASSSGGIYSRPISAALLLQLFSANACTSRELWIGVWI